MARGCRESGFVLLMTLVLAALATIMLAGLARRSVTAAVACQSDVEALQRRWAIRSCQETVLPWAAWLMTSAERGVDPWESLESGNARTASPAFKPRGGDERSHIAELRLTCRLAGADYLIVITDEQAKLNANGMLATAGDRLKVQRAIEAVTGSSTARADGKVRLRPATSKPATANDAALPLLGAYEQVFDGASPSALLGARAGDGLASAVTLWGNGKVNIRRAGDEVIRQACEPRLDRLVINKLLRARAAGGPPGVADVITSMGKLDAADRSTLQSLLTDTSSCYGVWIVARGEQRDWYTLVIAQTVPPTEADEAAGPLPHAVGPRNWFEW